MKNLIGITMGDPKGIGPEIIAKAWRVLSDSERENLVIYGDLTTLNAAAELVGVKFNQKKIIITSSTEPPRQKIDETEAARLTISAIDAAVVDAKNKKLAGIVTAPINKHRMQSVKPNFSGHTDYIGHASHIKDPVMMFACHEANNSKNVGFEKNVCFSLVTMHIPFKEISAAITKEKVLNTIRKTHIALDKYFACPDSRIAVMSLNPHGGESGSIGTEEKTAIIPAIASALKEGINCTGPLAADSLFRKLEDFDFDAVVAMYHDQGLLPVKLLYQSRCVNITLGLPYVRTSPSHGTAEGIAWLGQADETAMLAAIRMARKLVGWNI